MIHQFLRSNSNMSSAVQINLNLFYFRFTVIHSTRAEKTKMRQMHESEMRNDGFDRLLIDAGSRTF